MAHEVKKKIQDIYLDITIGKLANKYFGKKSSWLYDKLNVRETQFTPEEILQLKGALVDLSERIRRCADTL